MNSTPDPAAALAGRSVIHQATVAAAAETVFDTVANVQMWPQLFESDVHAEVLEQGHRHDVIRCWALAGAASVRCRTSRREIDRDGLRIGFEQVDVSPPLAATGGEWIFKPVSDAQTHVELRHTVRADGPAASSQAAGHLTTRAEAQLAAVKHAAERADELSQLVLSFEDPLFAAGSAEDAYQILYEADKWPERLEHVLSLTMTEDEPNVQFFDMDTRTPDGAAHTTRSVRICLPYREIVYKQVKLPVLLEAHTGHWRFTPTPEGVIVSARHTVTIKPGAIPQVLGAGATVRDARRYLRKVLSANSMKNLQLAKRFAEERADG